MRISDWSSDVCFSDLNDLPSDEEAVKLAQEALNIASPGADRPNVCWQGLSKALRRHRRPAKRPPPPPSGATATFELSKLHQPAEDPPRLGTPVEPGSGTKPEKEETNAGERKSTRLNTSH